jgi:7-carboxy-7-deazaguanine synthase
MALLVKEMFRTLQGEGTWAGTPSVFVRLAGCNLWSGHEEDREQNARANGAQCPSFCDTDFVGGQRLEVEELAGQVLELASSSSGQHIRHVVFTGGEPLVQINRHPKLLEAVRRMFPHGQVRLALETNGTVSPRAELLDKSWYGKKGSFDWICVSPKVPLERMKLRHGDELKVVFPSYDPLEYAALEREFQHLLVSPEFPPAKSSLVKKDVLERAVQFCLENPSWKLSVQQHKYWNIP